MRSATNTEERATIGADENLDKLYTIAEFCDVERMSPTTYHKLKRRGRGPEEFRLPNSSFIRITSAARRAWRARMTELSAQDDAQREIERRREAARAAGRKAAKSDKHVSKTKRGRRDDQDARV